jgi:hypothetical protein
VPGVEDKESIIHGGGGGFLDRPSALRGRSPGSDIRRTPNIMISRYR